MDDNKNVVLDTESECFVFPSSYLYLKPEGQYVFICDKKTGEIKRVLFKEDTRKKMQLNIGIIDADLLNSKKSRFPNLACMKISGYYKEKGENVNLVTSYNNLEQYDKIFISKVFTATEVPTEVLKLPNVEYGGTGFYFDKASPLPYEIEHHSPDYHLYDGYIDWF